MASAWRCRVGGSRRRKRASRFSPSISTAIASTVTMATLAMPLTKRAGQLGDALVGELLGQLAHPLLDLVADLVVAQPAADERQLLQLVDRRRELVGELAGLVDRPRAEDEDEQGGEGDDPGRDDHDGDAATHVEPPLQGVDERVEGEGDEHADADAREHRRGVA